MLLAQHFRTLITKFMALIFPHGCLTMLFFMLQFLYRPRFKNFYNIILFSQAVRTSLMPGILKTVAHNKDHPKPIKVLF